MVGRAAISVLIPYSGTLGRCRRLLQWTAQGTMFLAELRPFVPADIELTKPGRTPEN